jgi:hypothetical protein
MRSLSMVAVIALGILAAAGPRADERRVYDGQGPAWLAAIGRLEVPGSRYNDGRREHFTEDCSATLVQRPGQRQANTLLTAWHCLEKYTDLSKPIRFVLADGVAPPLAREAYVLGDGGSIGADWALLRLYRPIPADRVRALGIDTDGVDSSREIVMAGFSRDPGLGAGGTRLTYDPACRVTKTGTTASTTDCVAHKGASGGAVIQVDEQGRPAVHGVISEGDGVGVSTFVPASAFRRAVRDLL